MIIFILGTLLGILGGGAVCVRYLRHEIAADIGPQLPRFGHTKIQGKKLLVRGLNALAATVSTPLSAPVIAAMRLRGGNATSARGAAGFAARAIATAREAGCTGTIVVRLDSGFYSAAALAAIGRGGHFSRSPCRCMPRSAP